MTSKQPILIRRINEKSKMPMRHSAGAAAYDIHSVESVTIPAHKIGIISTGLVIKCPMGVQGMMYSRSGLAAKYSLEISGDNIAPGEEKEINVTVVNNGNIDFCVEEGDRIAQLVFISVYDGELTETSVLSDSERGEQGFGSTGKK